MQWSSKRCPRSSCPSYGRRLVLEVGQHETRGDLTTEARCMDCGYVETGPSTAESARRTSATVAEVFDRILAQRQRLTGDVGVEIPLTYDDEPVEVER